MKVLEGSAFHCFSIIATVLLLVGLFACQSDNTCVTAYTPAPTSIVGLYDFGPAVRKGSAKGVVVTKCGPTQFECIVAIMSDFSEDTAFTIFGLLVIDARTGNTVTVDIPGPEKSGTVFSSLLDNEKRFYYTHFASTLYQFDTRTMSFTFYQNTHSGMAMSFTVGDDGIIWGGTHEKCGLFSFNPLTRQFNDYGAVHKAENWEIYPRSIAVDDLGFVYLGVAFTFAQFIAFNPNTTQYYPLIRNEDRPVGSGTLYRDLDGAVYGTAGNSSVVHKMYNGTILSGVTKRRTAKQILSGDQNYVYRSFPSGNYLLAFDADNMSFSIRLVNGTVISRSFSYSCRGANIMNMVSSPDKNQLIGSSSFPMNMFSLNSKTDLSFENFQALDQWNAMKTVDDNIWIGTYPKGRLLLYNPKKPYVYTQIGNNQSNPLFLATSAPHVIRPSCVLVHPNREHVLMSGEPEYGKTGGGLLIWNRKIMTSTVVEHTQLLTYHSVYSMSAIHNSNNMILCGTTIEGGTGGQNKATEAELFLFDLNTLKNVKRFKPFNNVKYYYELFYCKENNS